MTIIDPSYIQSIYPNSKEDLLFGRWITCGHIQKVFPKYNSSKDISYVEIGRSEENRPIFQFTLGNGPVKVLIWSQMHGNESTGTKAVFDFLNYINSTDDHIKQEIMRACTFQIIPVLNPDGAEYYTRVNAHKVDLNRDAVDRKAKESQLLRQHLEDFNPDFCFNLHDQRTIFGVEGTQNPATISFLAPSEEVTRKLTPGRKKTMNVIVAMNQLLQQIIPGHVGRYTDEFYPTATGDNFQKLGYSTILIESGHFPEDYDREECRKFTFVALLKGIYHIATSKNFEDYEDYFTIPDNSKNFRDLLHKYADKQDVAFQYEESLKDGNVIFSPKKLNEDISGLLFHKEIVFET